MSTKESVLGRLENDLTSMSTKLAEAKARIRFMESTRRRTLEAMQNKHTEHVEKIRASIYKSQRSLKAKLTKSEKLQADAYAEREHLAQEVSTLQTALADVTRTKGTTMGEIESLSSRVRSLNEQLTESLNSVESERNHSSQLERNLHEVGKQFELVLKENKRLQQLHLEQEKTRDSIIATHGEQMRALSETVDRRTFQLNESELKLEEARKSRDEAVDALDRHRHGHGMKRTKMDEDMSKLRREVEDLKDQLSESKRERNVDGGRMESLGREVEELRTELKDKNERLSKYDNQLGAGRDNVHHMTTRVAELEGQLSSLQLSTSEQEKRDKDTVVSLRCDLKDEKIKSTQLASSLKEIEAEKQGLQRNVESLERQINTLESALERYRSTEPAAAAAAAPSSTSLSVAVTGPTAGVSADEVTRLHQELAAKNVIIQKKEEEIITLKVTLKDLEAEVARRTLRAAGMAANKITEEKKRMQEQSAVQSRQMEAEMREKDRLLQEKESALEEERKQREISDTLASEKLKWEEEQRNKEREESDQGRQERWLLMQRMQEMERDVDGLAQAKKEAKVLNKTKEIYAKRKVMEEKEKEMESWSSSLKTLPNVETMERKEPEAMDANMEEHLRSLSQRAEALQEEADVRHVGSPELIERVERLTLELAERIAIETYDVGEHLFEIMDDMHPVLRQSELRTRSRNSRPRDVADAKNTAAAAMSVARTRVRAALHLSKDGVLYWLLTLYGNVASLLQSLRRPELADYDTALSPRGRRERRGKRERGENPSDDDPNAIVASRDLVRVCSNQWTERRWPSESSGMLSEVRAAVEKAAEDEYWRRYSEAMSNVPGRHMSGERDASTTSVDEPDANRMFWQLLVSGRMLSYVFSSSFSFSLQQEN